MAESKKMKGLLLDKVGGEFRIVDDLDVPTPGPGQVLVKSLVTGINPVEGFMQQTGMLVTSFPVVLGCDASGIVVGRGPGLKKFSYDNSVREGIFGCTRLGMPGYGTFQEYFLMDEHLAFKRPESWTDGATEMGATVGVGLLTACLGLVSGLKIELAEKKIDENSKWVIILGAAGGVGQFSVQVAKICGYKVLASCSPSNNELVKSLGADATFNYKIPLDEQLKEIGSVTGGSFSKIYDPSAFSAETGMAALATSTEHGRIFATTNDWMPIEEKEGIDIFKVALGQIGRTGGPLAEVAVQVNRDIAAFIPKLEKWLESGQIKPPAYVTANEGKVGLDSVLKALEDFNTKKSDGRKLIAKVGTD